MVTTAGVDREMERAAIGRVLECVHRARKRGRLVFPLVELSEETGLDPNTAEAAMTTLESTGPYDVSRLNAGEIRWRVEGSAYDLDGWSSDAWNVP